MQHPADTSEATVPYERSPVPGGGAVTLLHAPASPVAVQFDGEIDASWAAQAQRRLVEALLHHRPDPIVIDLRGATRLDPRVLGAILATIDSAGDLDVPVQVLLGAADPSGGLLGPAGGLPAPR
ncbi:STAS domain-containing protein [Dactylosporangium sp. NPDC051485]|uniref:STAS domain-containing protein n=1 Tax=Dactylosporangium sp. NPDC051485 TaxID=3154846 RepID=UPI0034350520